MQWRIKSPLEPNTKWRAAVLAALVVGAGPALVWGKDPSTTPIPIAVFDFELEDLTPASALLNKSTTGTAALEKATAAATRELTSSGRYRVITATNSAAQASTPARLRECDGCEAKMALKLGAQQSLLGIVRRATQTDYYIVINIRDAHTGELVNQQAANFAGGEDGWASGARMLLDHQVLYPDQPERLSSSEQPQCKEATVSPVSGFAECIDPRGAPVAPPPARPDSPTTK
jgi:hypothetical protein